jgi:hypothetical protein
LLWACAAYFAFLLSPASSWVYERIPGFALLQFPWRLLSFVSVLAVTLAAYPLLCDRSISADGRSCERPGSDRTGVLAVALASISYVVSPWMHPIRYEWFSSEELEAKLEPTARVNVGGFEYHPKVHGWEGMQLVSHLGALEPSPSASQWTMRDYSVRRLDEPAFEKGNRVYRINAASAATVILPLAYSRSVLAHRLGSATAQRLATYRTEDDPRIHVDVDPGETDIEFRFPTVWNLMFGG